MVEHRRISAASLLFILAVHSSAAAALDDPAFEVTVLTAPSGQAGTTGIAWAPDGSQRLFYTRQNGRIRIVDAGVIKNFATFSPVHTESECGALSVAFDPDFVNNHYVYAFVTRSVTEQQIVRFTAEANVAKDETLIVGGLPTRGVNHDAGGIGFGPDGKLYWTIGDLGNHTGSNGDLSTVAGKVSRVNLDGSAPQDNPFFDGDGPNEDRIWAQGFRNPFSFTWEPSSERLWINVVGSLFEQIISPRAGDNAGWHDFENLDGPGILSPLLAYPTSGSGERAITPEGLSRAAGITTLTTLQPHRLRVGHQVTISGASDASFDGTGFVSEVLSPIELRFAQPGVDASSGAGVMRPLDLGNAITGGAFWDSSAVPAEYRGNFFFGDYVSSEMARVTLGPEQQITSLRRWGKAEGRMIDLAVGPDGDLYYATFEGGFYRVRYKATEQGIVVSRLHARVPEGGGSVLSVRLAIAPTTPLSVNVALDGDPDVKVATTELTFDAASWSEPQALLVTAQQDDDADQDEARVVFSSPGLPPETTLVRVTDDEPLALVVTPSELSLEEGSEAKLSISLNGGPSEQTEAHLEATVEPTVLTVKPSAVLLDRDNWSDSNQVTVSANSLDGGGPTTQTLRISGRGLVPADVQVTIEPRPPRTGAGGAGAAGSDDGGTDGAGGEPNLAPVGQGGGIEGGAPGEMPGAEPSGCGCKVPSSPGNAPLLLVLAGATVLRQRRRPRSASS
jgi:MYXO-CTERM domain-containing protein